jgi:hypothetical protein
MYHRLNGMITRVTRFRKKLENACEKMEHEKKKD